MIKDSLRSAHLLSLLVIVIATGLGQWLLSGDRSPTPLQRVRSGGPLLVGYALEPPFVVLDDDGRVTGEAPEVFRRGLAGVGPGQIIWVHSDFASLRHELDAGRIDVIVAGMFITPERERQLLFSIPTALLCSGLAVAAGNPLGLHGYADIARVAEARLGVIAGAVEYDEAIRAGVPAGSVVVLPDALSGLAAVRAGRISALALSEVSLRVALAGQEGLELAPLKAAQPSPPARPAFAFRPADRDLRDALDRVLAAWLGQPEHVALIERFGFTRDELPGRRPQPGCAG